jgi:hypothetical protein
VITRYDLLPVMTDLAHHAVVDPRFAYVLSDDEMAQGSTIADGIALVVDAGGFAIVKLLI